MPLHDRERELEVFDGPLRGALAGRGDVVVVRGEAGIGKTALLEEVARVATERGLAVGWTTANEARSATAAVATGLLGPEVALHESKGLFAGAAAGARALFDGGDTHRDLDDEFAVSDALRWLTASLAEQRPLLLVVDDAHWADALSMSYLRSLAEEVAGLACCLVVALRSGEPNAEQLASRLAGASSVEILEPAPLEIAGIEGMVRDLTGAKTDGEVVATIQRLSGGNPLFGTEIIRALGTGGLAPGPIEEALPHSIGSLVFARLERLGDAAFRLAGALSVIDRSDDLDLAAEVAALDPAEAASAMSALEAADLVRPNRHAGFCHPIVRRVVADRLGSDEHSRIRVAAARILAERGEREEAAWHLSDAGDGVEPENWMAPLLASAAALSAGRGGRLDAIDLLDRAVSLAGDNPLRADLLWRRGILRSRARDAGCVADLAEARELTTDPIGRARIALDLGAARFYLVQLDEASEGCREAAAELGSRDAELALQLEAQALNADRLRGMETERPRQLEPRVAGARTAGERAVLAHVAAEAVARGDRPAGDVLELAAAAWKGGSLLSEVGPAAPLVSFLGTTFAWCEDFDATLELAEAQLREGTLRRSPVTTSYALALRAGTRFRLGDLPGAEADALQVIGGLPASDPLAHMISFGWQLEVLVATGRVVEATTALGESGLTGELPDLGTVDFLLLARAEVKAKTDDLDGARDDFREVGERAERSGYLNPAGLAWRSRWAWAELHAGNKDAAAKLAGEEVRRARRFGAPRALGIALRAVGACGDRDALTESVAVLSKSEARLELALARTDLAEALIAEGDLEAAREVLREAMDSAHSCGAPGLVDRAMAGLRAAGMRPRRPALRGVDALTVQQLRVARLAAEGKTNREIAETLFLARRTVELHLTGAFRKLGVTSRDEVASALDRAASD